MNTDLVSLDLANYDAFTSANDCLVIIYKEHCPFCEVVFKVIGKCLVSYPDLKSGKISSEDHPAILTKLSTRKVPTVIVYGKGQEKGRRSGVMNPAELSALIEKPA